MPYLQCPECRLTVPAASYYLRGDECPRCLATMEKRASFRRESAPEAHSPPLGLGPAAPPGSAAPAS